MCLAIFKPAKVDVPESHLAMGWQHNPDGAGFAYVHKAQVVTTKGFMTYKEFLAAYKAASSKYKTSPFLIHFRIRSMGEKSAVNTHPYPIPGGALIHNGTITGTAATHGSGPSDTFFFAKEFGEQLSYDFALKNRKEWEDALDYNKVVLLYEDKRFLILNETSGEWNSDVWYSNKSYVARPSVAPQHPYHSQMME